MKEKVTMTLGRDVVAAVDAEARLTGRARSNLVDYILRQWMAQNAKAKK